MWDVPESGEVIKDTRRRETIIAYIVLLVIISSMLIRALLSIFMFPERPRTWNYRTHTYVPGETYASTRPASPRTTDVPQQVPLPPPPPQSTPPAPGGEE